MSVRCGCIVGPKEASRPLAQDLCLSLRRWGREFVLWEEKSAPMLRGTEGREWRRGKSPKVKVSIYRINNASGKATNNAGTIGL